MHLKKKDFLNWLEIEIIQSFAQEDAENNMSIEIIITSIIYNNSNIALLREEAVIRRCSVKKMHLEILQNS